MKTKKTLARCLLCTLMLTAFLPARATRVKEKEPRATEATPIHAPEAYRLFNGKGQRVTYAQLISGLAGADIVLLGEIHNCAMTHWLEFKIMQALHQVLGSRLALGLEMLEADNQLIVDEHLKGLVSSDRFEEEARLWPNYSTDYAPLVYFAREHHLPVIATEVPRRYAAMVKDRGLKCLDSLSAEAKTFLPPLPIRYVANEHAEQGFALMRMMGQHKTAGGNSHLSEAQALKDATMAWHIAQHARKKVLHVNGNIHSDGQAGIVTYLRQYALGKKIITVRAVRQEDVTRLDETYLGLADYYLCIPEDMSMSY